MGDGCPWVHYMKYPTYLPPPPPTKYVVNVDGVICSWVERACVDPDQQGYYFGDINGG